MKMLRAIAVLVLLLVAGVMAFAADTGPPGAATETTTMETNLIIGEHITPAEFAAVTGAWDAAPTAAEQVQEVAEDVTIATCPSNDVGDFNLLRSTSTSVNNPGATANWRSVSEVTQRFLCMSERTKRT